MEWIIRIEGEKNKRKRIKITFNPIDECINFWGEYKVKNRWEVFSHKLFNNLEISLEEIQENLEIVLVKMNHRVEKHENLEKGFSVLEWIAYEDDVE